MFIQIGDISMYYEAAGSGRPLILVHGNGEDHTIFDSCIPLLTDRFTVYSIDSRSHGKSSAAGELHYEDMACDMIAFMDALDLHDVLFYGFSDGGIIGLLTAMKTDRISTLAVSGANVTPSGVKAPLRTLLRIISLFAKDPKIELMLKEPHITAGQLQTIRIPTLVLAGEKDLVKEEETRFIADHIPHSRLHIIKGEGHGSYIVHNAKLARYLIMADSMRKD